MAASKEAQTLREEVAGLSNEDTRQMAQPRFPVEPGGFRFCQLADALGSTFLAVTTRVFGSLCPGGCYDDSHSVQAGYSGAGFADRIDICWFRRIVSTRR
jgi:hypothetical protein